MFASFKSKLIKIFNVNISLSIKYVHERFIKATTNEILVVVTIDTTLLNAQKLVQSQKYRK